MRDRHDRSTLSDCRPVHLRFEEALQRASSLQRRSLDASMMSPAAGPGELREPPSPMGCATDSKLGLSHFPVPPLCFVEAGSHHLGWHPQHDGVPSSTCGLHRCWRGEHMRRPPGRFLGEQSDDDDVNEVEMLLEAYFIQVDNTHNKLQTLHEYIDDTEVCHL